MSAHFKPIEAMRDAELIDALKDPHWRIRNIYWVTDKDGKAIRFQPWPEQEKFLDNIWFRNVIPKARQRGFSTVVQIMMLDACLFVPNTSAAVIAQDDQTAKTIFQKKIKFAWERLPPLVREMVGTPTKNNEHELAWKTDSSMIVSTSTRGNTLQYLHISEYGQICAKFPDRADEILEGSLPSVDQHGVVVIESTVETPFGHFSDIVRRAQATHELGRELSPMDYRLHFASWWDADEYEADPKHVVMSSTDQAYFYRLEAEIGQPISDRKRAWYIQKRDNEFGGNNEKMFRQYPSTLKEAFAVSTDALWLSMQLARARTEKRIGPLPVMAGIPVNTFWDIGVDDDNAVWLHQEVGPFDHFIAYEEASGEPYSTIVRQLQKRQSDWGFVWGTHYLPHDADQRRPGAETLKTPRDMLSDLGLKNMEIVPRIAEVTVGIDQLREDFATYRFDETHCAEGIKHLEGFSKVYNNSMGIWSPQIMKNGHQHAADALRQKAQWAHRIRGAGGKKLPSRRNRSGMAA